MKSLRYPTATRNACQTAHRRVRCGMTLLEVLLAAVILAGALAALSQLAANGVRASLRTELETIACIKCQTKMDEILSMPDQAQFDAELPFPDDHHWRWLAELRPGPSDGLLLLSVTVTRSGSPEQMTRFQLSRLINRSTDDTEGLTQLVSKR